jgi:hypothetical protein
VASGGVVVTIGVWLHPITELEVSNGTARWRWRSQGPLIDFYPADEPVENLFTFGASDYDVGDDEMYCPCGATLEACATLGEPPRGGSRARRHAAPRREAAYAMTTQRRRPTCDYCWRRSIATLRVTTWFGWRERVRNVCRDHIPRGTRLG